MDASVLLEPVNIPDSCSWNISEQPSTINTEYGNKGFPFDDSDLENRDRGSFHSQLDDLARRHPELAEHLNFDNQFNDFPSLRSNTWGHNRRRDSSSPFTDNNSESSRFRPSSRFGTPLSSAFEKEFDFPFSKGFHESVPSQTQEPQQAEKATEKPPQVPSSKERSRKSNPNVPQSNTVDLGQKQEPVKDTREQRSMSAPPENRAGQQRFVSSINIPVQGENDSNTAQPQTQQWKQQQTANERVIPIHVEGRDEPVMPKNPNSFNQSQPQQEKVYTQKPAGFTNPWNRRDIPYYTGEPQFQYEEPHNFYNSHHNEASGNTGTTFKQPKPQQDPPQSQIHSQQQQQEPQPEQAPTPPPPPPSIKFGPIEQIQRIQKDVLELMNQVEKFNGKPKDKDYAYLDEMLTRNLLKLDDVETEGKDKIRNARKEAIKCIQKCISILEAKANANELLHNQLIDISKAPLTSLEISGISRSGTEASVPQEESLEPEEEPISTETENKEDIIPMQTNESESIPSPENTTTDQEQNEPAKSENEVTDIQMSSEIANVEVIPTTADSEGTKEQPMEVQESKEKKDKKKVKKKVDKLEKN